MCSHNFVGNFSIAEVQISDGGMSIFPKFQNKIKISLRHLAPNLAEKYYGPRAEIWDRFFPSCRGTTEVSASSVSAVMYLVGKVHGINTICHSRSFWLSISFHFVTSEAPTGEANIIFLAWSQRWKKDVDLIHWQIVFNNPKCYGVAWMLLIFLHV